jgi:hexosaminidase
MRRLWLDLEACPAELRGGMAEIVAEYPKRFTHAKRLGTALTFEHAPALKSGGLAVARRGSACSVRYGRKVDAFRALGRLMGEAASGGARRGDFSETPRFDLLGIMIDVSRNGVLAPEAVRAMLRRCALMGLNMAILYSEDTYEVPGEPFFGYLRGRYTHDEMKSLDDCADSLGIEMFPCIQTLAHLEQVLQWPAYRDYRDTDRVLLAGDEKTYALLDKMIAAASAPFRSKRIHIGMDEAHDIGAGRYRQLHGERRPFDILNDHLARVRDLCTKRGLKPMIWSDMYFRLGSKTNDYYDRDCVIPPDVVAKIPKDVQLVYWDYYHYEADFYADLIEAHRALGSEPIFAGGVWT